MFSPRRRSVEECSISGWEIGSTTPSAAPMSPRNSSRLPSPPTSPENAEKAVKVRIAATSSGLRRSIRSDR
jgi:hypothetical protein